MKMKRTLWAGLPVMFLLAGCLMEPGPRGVGVTFVPILPAVVVLDAEPYYFHEGYHYYYRDNGWYYAQSRSGPWVALPRDHYPKEVHYKNGGGERGGRHETDRQER